MNASFWELVRAGRGPVMLITFGTLVALNHTEKLDFERSWPMLIIVYGLLKLLERMVAPVIPPGVPPPSWQPPQQQPGYTASPYVPPQYPPVYPPPQSPQGGAQ